MMSPGSRVDSVNQDLDATGLVHINASEYFPKKSCIPDDPNLVLPFPALSGEYVEFLGRTAEDGIIALSNYRIFIQYPQSYVNLPVRMIEQADIQNYNNSIVFTCKNGTTIRVSFLSPEKSLEWQKRILNAVIVPKKLEDLFAFTFYAWKSEERNRHNAAQNRCFNTLSAAGYAFDLSREVKRMRFDSESWRISEINVKYEISPTYPKFHIVPSCVVDTDLTRIAEFRSSRRFPSIVWRNRKNGSVIARSSQPELGFFGWRCAQDENLLQAITTACSVDRVANGKNGHDAENGAHLNGDSLNQAMPKLLILDARSYAAAVANRAKGGGSEYAEYYPNCEIQYMSMANIHTVRKSFYQLRQLSTSPPDRIDFFSALDKTLWLHHVSAIIRTTCHVTNAVDVEARPVLVHCSDGWDRTTQIVALAMLMLDAHYRTIKGFQTLIEWQWLEFGHKFADRCGHGANNDETERCPIFLQWLDCVYQLISQFPIDFEFNEAYLIHLAHHVYSCFFGTFLCNNPREREKNSVNDRTYSLWNYLQQEADECFSNLLYTKREMVLRPDYNVRSLGFWGNLYVTEFNPLSANVHPAEVTGLAADLKICNPSLPRTRSVENLSNNGPTSPVPDAHSLHRASSVNNILLTGTSVDDSSGNDTGVASSPTNTFVGRVLHKSSSLPTDEISMNTLLLNGDTREETPSVSQSVPNLPLRDRKCSLDSTKSVSASVDSGLMERSTDTITGEDAIQTLLLERYPSSHDVNHDVRIIDDEEPSDGPSSAFVNPQHFPPESNCTMREDYSWKDGVCRFDQRISESLMASAMFSDANFLHNGNGMTPRRSDSKAFINLSVTPTPLKMVEGNHHSPVSSPTRPRRTSRHLTSASSSDSVHSDGNDSYQEHSLSVVRTQLGPDGLAILHDEKQSRMRAIRDVYQQEVDTLRRELASVKSSLKMYNGFTNGSTPHIRRDSCSDEVLSGESNGLAGDTVDFGTSCGSDVSWDNIDDKEALATHWVPDQSVTKCTNCESRFWLGKRKHHCRKCGLVFCGNCSDYQIPLPQDRLYYPVRVCRACYVELHKQNSGLRVLVNRRHAATAQPTHA